MVYSYMQESAEKEEMLKLAEMDKREMENEYKGARLRPKQ